MGDDRWEGGGAEEGKQVLFPDSHSPVCGGGGGGTPLYKPYRYAPLQRVGFLHRLGLKTGIDLAQFGLESAFEGATVVYEHICRLISNE